MILNHNNENVAVRFVHTVSNWADEGDYLGVYCWSPLGRCSSSSIYVPAFRQHAEMIKREGLPLGLLDWMAGTIPKGRALPVVNRANTSQL